MPQLRDFLDRFRPAGAPGAAARARAGVPADRSRELAAEVGPVLALLDEPTAEGAALVERARQDAASLLAAARAEAAAITANGARRARTVREEALQEAVGAAQAEAARMVADAQARAAQVQVLAEKRMPGLVERAVAEIRLLMTAEPDTARAGSAGTEPAGPGLGRSPGAAGP